jgi:phage baseplate assembly protein W
MAEEDKWTPSTARRGTAFPNSKLTYKDISADFDANAITGDIDPVKDAISVKRGITNILLTSMFERLMQPELGSNLKDVLFEPIDEITTARIEREVRSAIDAWEKRAEVINVFVDPDEDYNRYKVSVTFRPINAVVEEQVEVFLARER